MTQQNHIKQIKEKLAFEKQEYIVERGDNLSFISATFNYRISVLAQVNEEYLAGKGRSASDLRPGDKLILPKYDDYNHIERYKALLKKQSQNDEHFINAISGQRTGKAIAGSKEWNGVRIYWAEKDKENKSVSFDKTFPFAQIHDVEGDEVKSLKHKVYINRFENLYGNVTQKDDKAKIQSFQEAHIKLGTHEKAYQESIKPTKEYLIVPSEIKTDNKNKFDPKASIKATTSADPKDPKAEAFFRAGRIASAVSQYVIVRIELPEAIDLSKKEDIAKLPDFESWAFLQPPTIGMNKYRMTAHNGWVVDDAQKAGWFHANIFGSKAKKDDKTGLFFVDVETIKRSTYSNLDNRSYQIEQELINVVKDKKAYIKVDSSDPKAVYFKFEVIVQNYRSKDDYKRLRDTLIEQEKYNEVLSIECGSYMKTWVRNLHYFGDEDTKGNSLIPRDEYSENLRLLMQKLDKKTFDNVVRVKGILKGETKANQGYNPQLYRNHSWRRERLVSGDWETQADGNMVERSVDSSEKGYGDLLYVGLYPAELIESLNLLDQPKQPGQPRKLNFPVWLGTSVVFGMLMFGLKSLIKRMAERKASKEALKSTAKMTAEEKKEHPKRKTIDYWQYHYGQTLFDFMNKAKVKDLIAMIAVGGLTDGFDLEKTAEKLEKLFDGLTDTTKIKNTLEAIDSNQSDASLMAQLEQLYKGFKADTKVIYEKGKATQKTAKEIHKELKENCTEEVNIVKTYELTLKIFTHVMGFALIDPTNKYVIEAHKKKIKDNDTNALGNELAKEWSRIEGKPAKGMFQRVWGRADIGGTDTKDMFNNLKIGLLEGFLSGETKFDTGDINLISFADQKITPAPIGSPLPFPLSFLFWSFKVALSGSLNLKATASYQTAKKDQKVKEGESTNGEPIPDVKKGQSYADLLLELGTGSDSAKVEVAFQLQAAWTAAMQVYDDGKTPSNSTKSLKGLNDVRWGGMLYDVFEHLEVSLTAAAQLHVGANLAWQFGYLFEQAAKGKELKKSAINTNRLQMNLKRLYMPQIILR